MTRRPAPRFPYAKALEKALPGWDVSLVFVTEAKAKAMNVSLRKKTYVPNVLSYETGMRSGEIVICLAEAKRQASSYDMPYSAFVGFLFIHALAHLKGMPHGATMDRYERAMLARFISVPSTSNAPKNLRRNRHRDASDKSGHRRGSRDPKR